ncbi:MAG: SGNH/GDSL hydrolase family protein [Candidatus Melainabacteria bacterium]|nr:SGNH/GDSL hydrolase family protein [Candidatus Melainabacteria bacterium]
MRNKLCTKGFVLNCVIGIFSILLCFIVSEIYFRFCHIHTDGFGLSLACKHWFKKYYKPLNSFGYRDREWTKDDLKNKSIVLIVGDSLVAGEGIENVSDRFSDILVNKLGAKYAVINVSECGLDTGEEIQHFRNFPYKADLIIWSYYPNDIEGANFKEDYSFSNIDPPKNIDWLVSSSYFVNYIYWKLTKWKIINSKKNYLIWLKEQFDDPSVWKNHKQELEEIYKLCEAQNSKLLVVLFPILSHIPESQAMLVKINKVFNALNVPVLDISKLISDVKKKELVVSDDDPHPSKKLHKIVAENLYPLVIKSLKGDSK